MLSYNYKKTFFLILDYFFLYSTSLFFWSSEDFCNVYDRIVVFFFFFFRKIVISFVVFLYFFDNIYLKIFLQFFIMDLTMILWLLFYHKRVSKRIKKKQFTCLEENTEKYITFTVPIEKEDTKIDKNGEEITKKYILHITIYW